jgi:molybdate transport system substrate-binding protein
MKKKWMMSIIFMLISVTACTNQDPSAEKIINVSAAASLKGPVSEWEEKYERKHPKIDIKVNYGASGVLVNQIEKGASIDLLFSAQKIDRYIKNKEAVAFYEEGTIAANELVFVAGKHVSSPVKSIDDVPSNALVGVGDPKWVPAGFYAQKALSSMNVLHRINRIVYSQNAVHLKGLVESGSVDYAILYKTDAIKSNRISIIQVIPQKWYPVIEYPVYRIGAEKKEANDFLDFAKSEEGHRILKKYSFRESVQH